MYKIQIGRGGKDWEDYTISIGSDELEEVGALSFWIEKVHYIDDYDGKYVIRIIDENEKVVFERHAPYEGTRINIMDTNKNWLEDIRRDYGIDVSTWRRMVKAWLDLEEIPF